VIRLLQSFIQDVGPFIITASPPSTSTSTSKLSQSSASSVTSTSSINPLCRPETLYVLVWLLFTQQQQQGEDEQNAIVETLLSLMGMRTFV
jgi:hypothetical protein